MISIPDLDDNIVAPATPPGRSAIAVLRVSGKDSVDALSRCFSRPDALRGARSHQALHGHITNGGEVLDEVMVTVFRDGRGYTGEEAAEISCHGSPVIQAGILRLLLAQGFRQAVPGEFSLRAVANGRMDLTQAEAVRELIDAQTLSGTRAALQRLSGATRTRLTGLRERLLRVAAAVTVELDYPDDEVDTGIDHREGMRAVHAEVTELLASYRYGRLLQNGAVVVFAGAPNAGKSSLFNRVLGEDRAIVSDIPGTTRDYLESNLDLDGLPIRLVDTAGLRESPDPLEREGTRRTGTLLSRADLILAVVDASDRAAVASPEGDDPLSPEQTAPRLLVWNKMDSPAAAPAPEGAVPVSARTGAGIPQMLGLIRETLMDGAPPELSIASERQQQELAGVEASLAEALAAWEEGLPLDALSLYLQEALSGIGAITGEIRTDEILDVVFSGFCVGK